MKRVPPIVWAVVLLGASYLFFKYAIAPITNVLTGISAPLPSSLVLMYTATVAIAILVFVSVQDEQWNRFCRPITDFLRDTAPPSQAKRVVRGTTLAVIPLLIGWGAYLRETAQPQAPSDPPGIHFSLPGKYVSIENPLPWSDRNIREGGILYTQNCAMCHGDGLDGNGLFARAWLPKPANFRDSGTIAQLAENYVYWRIKEGGPGIPRGAIGYRSAMPAWDGVLTDDEIWKIIMFEYTSAGHEPARREL